MKRPPVYSPVTVGGLVSGLGACLSGGASDLARVSELVREEYGADSLLTESGTSALTLALHGARAILRSTGREAVVALPAYGCFDLASGLVGSGLSTIPYDIVPATLGPDWPSLSSALDGGATVVVMAHWYGIPVDAQRLLELAARHDAIVIDDAAQGVGASLGARPVGTWGDFGVLSFGRGKGRTGGGGGALLLNSGRSREVVAQLVLPRARRRGGAELVKLSAQWALGRPALYWIPASLPFLNLGDTPYHPPSPVMPMPASCAGALASAWAAAPDASARRRKFAAQWRAGQAALRYPMSEAKDVVQGELRLPILAADARERAWLLGTGPGAMPAYPSRLADLPAIQSRLKEGDWRKEWPGAGALVNRLVTLAGAG